MIFVILRSDHPSWRDISLIVIPLAISKQMFLYSWVCSNKSLKFELSKVLKYPKYIVRQLGHLIDPSCLQSAIYPT